jgi:hypothetical protein
MIVYQIIKSCSITYIEQAGMNIGFHLDVGDYVFIERDSHWIMNQHAFNGIEYIKTSVLVKIYYNKMINLDGCYEWTWVENVNVTNPKINDGFRQLYVDSDAISYVCKDVTIQWERNEKLKHIAELC